MESSSYNNFYYYVGCFNYYISAETTVVMRLTLLYCDFPKMYYNYSQALADGTEMKRNVS